jgi:inner membrane protein
LNLITHISLGLLLTLLVYNYLPAASNLNTLLIIAAFGSLLPDIDHPKAYLSRSHWLLQGGSHLVEALAHHRGITHSLLALIAFTCLSIAGLIYYQQALILALPFFIGYLSHLLADSLNPSGVKWFQPLSHWTLRLNARIWIIPIKITTGSLLERLLGLSLGAVFIYLYLKQTGHTIRLDDFLPRF